TVFGVDVFVVEREQVPEAHYVSVELDPVVHLAEFNVAYAMVNVHESHARRIVPGIHGAEAREERAVVGGTLHEGVYGVAVDLDSGRYGFSVLVLAHPRFVHGNGAALHCLRKGVARVIHPESQVANTVAMALD